MVSLSQSESLKIACTGCTQSNDWWAGASHACTLGKTGRNPGVVNVMSLRGSSKSVEK